MSDGLPDLRETAPFIGEPRVVLVVSDTHLGRGQDPLTRRFDRRENFFCDAAFRAFLAHHAPVDATGALLVFNGDTFDFLRINNVPRETSDLEAWSACLASLGAPRPIEDLRVSRWSKEGRFGLRTHDYKSVWKLLVMQQGHPVFFEALGEWVARGGAIVFVKGNHDVELHWPLVQKALRRMIQDPGTAADAERRVLFVEDGFVLGNVHIEHGHRFESTTAVHGTAELPGGEELRLPLGSFVNRYVINKLEGLELFLANVKPVNTLLWKVVRRHPLKIFTIAWYSIPLLRRSARPYFFKDALGLLLFFVSIVVPMVTVVAVGAAFLWPPFGRWVERFFRGSQGIVSGLGVTAPFIIGIIRDLLPRRKRKYGEDAFAEGVYEAMLAEGMPEGYRRIYGLLGHTHVPDAQRLPALKGAHVLYINSGTWTPRWEEERPDLLGRVGCTYIRLTPDAGEYVHELLDWEFNPGASAAPLVLEQDAGAQRPLEIPRIGMLR